jgi:hypothetical protein
VLYVNGISAIQKLMAEESLPGIFLFISEWVVNALLSALFLAEALFSISLLMICEF